MHALFFEVRPKPGHLKHYFAHVDVLKPVLARHEGLIFLDRYNALHDEEVLLSHQLWESDEAIVGWRKDSTHRRSQAAGRGIHFADYRIRVAERVFHTRDGVESEDAFPAEAARYVVSAYGTEALQHPPFQMFKSVNHAASFIALAEAETPETARDLARSIGSADGITEAAVYRLVRDYGMHDRAQAPQ